MILVNIVIFVNLPKPMGFYSEFCDFCEFENFSEFDDFCEFDNVCENSKL